MKSFKAKIYKVGINPCAEVPSSITRTMNAYKGYIRVKGKIQNHPFQQTLVPVKNKEYRLFVNGSMLKGSGSKVGDVVLFFIEQDLARKNDIQKMPKSFRNRLEIENLHEKFKALTPSRQKDILRYLNYLKTEIALDRNIEKVINQLKK